MHLIDKVHIHRAERASEAVALGLIWSGLAVCLIVATLYDLGIIHF